MVGDKIKYTCKNCGWWTSIRQEWADLRPKRCMNKKCNTSFLKYKDALIVQLPLEVPTEIVKEDKPPKRGKKNEQQPKDS
jgi:hypothetical protein